MRLTLLAGLLLPLLPPPSFAAVKIAEMSGMVEVRRNGMTHAALDGEPIFPGSEIRTGRSSRCLILFDDSSKVEIQSNAVFTLNGDVPQKEMRLSLGFLKAWVAKTFSQRFTVRTPTAVCAVRGTEFGVDVGLDGNTSVELFKGLLGVGDIKGNEVLLRPGQRVDVTDRGLGRVLGSNQLRNAASEKARTAMKREVGLDMTKDEVQTAAALEMKSAIYQQGKALIDVSGRRVRLEEYIIRPTPNQFKLVVLNERESRFDYFYYLGTFNKALPDNLSIALQQIQGQADTPPEFFLSSYRTGRSNTQDSVVENASGGHLVDVNNNGQAADAVASAFNPAANSVVNLNVPRPGGTGNEPYYRTLFDSYSLAFNGVIHHSWAPTIGVAPYDGAPSYNPADTTGAQNTVSQLTYTDATSVVSPPNCSSIGNCTGYPDVTKLHNTIYLESPTGAVWEKFENYIISDEGKVGNVSDFAGATSGSIYKRLLLNWNFEQVITASEFQGRKIDLVVEPKILIQSGLVQ